MPEYKTDNGVAVPRKAARVAGFGGFAKILAVLLALPFWTAIPSSAASGKDKDKITYGEGLIINIPIAPAEVEKVVEEVAQNGVIRGTKEYNKDEFISGAKPADSSNVFPPWNEGGKVFYKVREDAIDPRNFKDSGDVGALVVRYVVLPQGDKNTVLRIDALFEETFRHTVHQSNGSIETSEYKDIREHLDAIELMKRQNVEAQRERQEMIERKQRLAMQSEVNGGAQAQPQGSSSSVSSSPSPTSPSAAEISSTSAAGSESSSGTFEDYSNKRVEVADTGTAPAANVPVKSLEDHVKDLRREVERLVKAPGAPLKSAPFHTAGTLQLLTPGTEVLILIHTSYWYGVETREGQHGWVQRDQVEVMP
jgi:hypothetical protein